MADTMDVRAVARFVPVSAQKARLVIDLIRGRSANEAMQVLQFTPNKSAEPVAKVLRSAIANAEQNYGLSRDDLVIVQATRRWRPAAPVAPLRRPRPFQADPQGDVAHHDRVERALNRPDRRFGRGARMGRKVHPIGFRLGINKTLGLALVRQPGRLRAPVARGSAGSGH